MHWNALQTAFFQAGACKLELHSRQKRRGKRQTSPAAHRAARPAVPPCQSPRGGGTEEGAASTAGLGTQRLPAGAMESSSLPDWGCISPRTWRATMPAQQKKIIFCIAGVFSFACALGTAAAIGTQLWIRGTILCKTGALLVNATGQELEKFIGEIQYGLFYGERVRQCGLGGRPFQFSCE